MGSHFGTTLSFSRLDGVFTSYRSNPSATVCEEVFDCPDLYSTQEEADTRMILQALHTDKRLKELGKQGRIIIKTSDTDVIVRACAAGRTLYVISEREEHSS
jgi:hypothetical protein